MNKNVIIEGINRHITQQIVEHLLKLNGFDPSDVSTDPDPSERHI